MKRALLALLAAALPALADVGTEHFFTNALAVAEGQTAATNSFDVYNDTNDSNEFILYRNGNYVSEIVTTPTGLSRRWQPFLRNGYLSVASQSSWSNRNRVGVRSRAATYRVMNSNRGSQTVCTIYTVFRPRTDMGWGDSNRNDLWGFGHSGNSTIVCWKDKGNNGGALILDFTVKNGNPGNQHYVLKIDPGQSGWNSSAWYLVAASFPPKAGEANNMQARFWMRELDPRGTDQSPDPIVGTPIEGDDYVSYYPAASSKWPFENTNSNGAGSMGIGGYLYNDGGNAGVVNGLGGDICYFRSENQYLDYSDFNDFFLSLGAPPDSTVVLFR